MMKRTAVMIAAAALACTMGATGVWAAGPGRTQFNRACTNARCLFADTDGDGVCDNRTDGTCRYDTDGDGVCDYAADGSCRNDADQDGVCDYRTTGGCHGGGHGWGCRD